MHSLVNGLAICIICSLLHTVIYWQMKNVSRICSIGWSAATVQMLICSIKVFAFFIYSQRAESLNDES